MSDHEWVVEVKEGWAEPTPIITHLAYLPALADVVREAGLMGGELQPAPWLAARASQQAWILRRPERKDVTITLTRWPIGQSETATKEEVK